MTEYRVELYDHVNPYSPFDILYVNSKELAELITYYRSLYDHCSKRKNMATIYYEFWGSSETDDLYLVVQEL